MSVVLMVHIGVGVFEIFCKITPYVPRVLENKFGRPQVEVLDYIGLVLVQVVLGDFVLGFFYLFPYIPPVNLYFVWSDEFECVGEMGLVFGWFFVEWID